MEGAKRKRKQKSQERGNGEAEAGRLAQRLWRPRTGQGDKDPRGETAEPPRIPTLKRV